MVVVEGQFEERSSAVVVESAVDGATATNGVQGLQSCLNGFVAAFH